MAEENGKSMNKIAVLGPWTPNAEDESVTRIWQLPESMLSLTLLAAHVDVKTLVARVTNAIGETEILREFDNIAAAMVAADEWLERSAGR
mgnify:FL=1